MLPMPRTRTGSSRSAAIPPAPSLGAGVLAEADPQSTSRVYPDPPSALPCPASAARTRTDRRGGVQETLTSGYGYVLDPTPATGRNPGHAGFSSVAERGPMEHGLELSKKRSLQEGQLRLSLRPRAYRPCRLLASLGPRRRRQPRNRQEAPQRQRTEMSDDGQLISAASRRSSRSRWRHLQPEGGLVHGGSPWKSSPCGKNR